MGRFHLNHLKLRDKLIFMYFLCVFIPIVLTNIFFYNVSTNNIINQKTHDADIALEQLQRELRAVIDEAAGISYLYYIDPVLNDHLNHHYASQAEYIEALNEKMRGMFNKSEQAYHTTNSTIIYTDNKTMLASGNILPLTESVVAEPWYQDFIQTNVSYPYLYVNDSQISMIQRMNNTVTSVNSIVKIDLNMATVRQLFANSGFEGNIYFVHPNQTVHFANDKEMDWSSGTLPITKVEKPEKPIEFNKLYANNNYLNGWALHGVMDEKNVLHEVRKSGSFIFYLAALNFLLPTIIIVVISRSIHHRLVRILIYMKKVKHQQFEPIPYEDSRDEIGQLTSEFNRMTARIDNLINDVYMADIQKKDLEIRQRQAQLHALHSQINPHFLFNALETIRMRSLMKGEGETARTINYMAKIFRKSISWKRSWVTIREEIELIECFLEIQKYRFGDKLQYQLTVEDAVYDQMIPKMTFLPFVENASIHGVEGSPAIGLIALHIGLSGNRLVFRLSDNGMGMTESKLDELLHYLKDDDTIGDNVGMKNVYTRLKLCYPDAFEFDIQSEHGKGTTVELRLPKDGKTGEDMQ